MEARKYGLKRLQDLYAKGYISLLPAVLCECLSIYFGGDPNHELKLFIILQRSFVIPGLEKELYYHGFPIHKTTRGAALHVVCAVKKEQEFFFNHACSISQRIVRGES